MYSCDKCKKLRNGLKFSQVTRLPDTLCIHLKRFRHDFAFSSKISTRVSFPLSGLEMSNWLHPSLSSTASSSSYSLSGVVCHHGTAGGGHYTCYCYHPDTDTWYEYDDSLVREVDRQTVLNSEAYVLFYRKDSPVMEEARREVDRLNKQHSQVDSVVTTLGDNTGGTVRPEVKQVFDPSRLQSFLGSGQASMAFPVLKGVTDNIFNGACGAFKKEMKEETIDDDDIDHDEREPSHSMDAIEDLVTVKEELMPLCNPSLFFSPFSLPPRLPLPLPLLPKRPRKRKLLPSSSSATSNFPSQSRRFYKCLGCGSSKRWDRLTDHYRKYVVFGPLGQPWVPNLETMTPEQYVHTLAFRDQGFSSDRMPQYKDHAEASQDNDDEFGIVEDGQDSMTGYGEDGQEFLAGQVQDSRDSFDAGDESAEAPSKLASEPAAAPEPVKTSQSLPVGQQPNIKMFWDNKTFSDVKIICNGGEVVAHRLILAAKHPLFYQVLIDCADDDYSVIMMPDHSFADVSDMVEDYYNFKTTENAFNVNDKGSNDHVDMKNTPSPSKVAKLQLPKKMDEKLKLSPFQFPSYVDVDKIEAPDDEEKVSTLPTIANSDTLDRLILKAGSVLCPTYSCKVPGCLFSVQRSLLCIKGHILTEHWGKLG
eukprot:GFUD01048775.1.p1 GENE.GFUD01048775.1~~GFUD01048775.1.p1  ORF type:complete len:752 (-),score=182.43 GFUD01048775.1:65-1999(-)